MENKYFVEEYKLNRPLKYSLPPRRRPRSLGITSNSNSRYGTVTVRVYDHEEVGAFTNNRDKRIKDKTQRHGRYHRESDRNTRETIRSTVNNGADSVPEDLSFLKRFNQPISTSR